VSQTTRILSRLRDATFNAGFPSGKIRHAWNDHLHSAVLGAFMGLLDSKPDPKAAAIEETTRLIPQTSRLDSAPAMSRLAMSSHL
jgi:hypothetical protein